MSILNENWEKRGNYVVHSSHNFELMKNKQNEIGPGFCIAKWNQVSLHLETGLTHSCHHPTAHEIPLAELSIDPSALHNTEFKKQQRKAMLEGNRPKECDYCWRVEDQNQYSDRQMKTIEPWALKDFDDISLMTGDENVPPKYLEVSFTNACNQKCIYCGPEFSTAWIEELKEQGPVVVLKEHNNFKRIEQGWQNLDDLYYKKNQTNPYIDAFWKWFPEIYDKLEIYRITGGEPLLSKDTFKSMEFFLKNPNTNLALAINSNLSVPESVWSKFIILCKKLITSKAIGKLTIFTSIESWGEQANYARYGLDFDIYRQRIEEIANINDLRCVFMSTYNILSVPSFYKILEWQLELKKKYNTINLDNEKRSHSWLMGIDIPYLRHPQYLDVGILTDDIKEKYMLPCLDFMKNNISTNHTGFEEYEMIKFQRIIESIDIPKENKTKLSIRRAKFYDVINEMDKRRGTNFLKTFPELKEFYFECEKNRNMIKYAVNVMADGEAYEYSS